jgi:MAF protein
MPRLILASASPRRRELLAKAGYVFDVLPAHVPEDPLDGEDPIAYVTRLAREKAEAVWRELAERSKAVEPASHRPGESEAGGLRIALPGQIPGDPIVLGADTTVTLDGHILAKPEDQADAVRMLKMLSGRTHRVITGVAVMKGRNEDRQQGTAGDRDSLGTPAATPSSSRGSLGTPVGNKEQGYPVTAEAAEGSKARGRSARFGYGVKPAFPRSTASRRSSEPGPQGPVCEVAAEVTAVTFVTLSDEEIREYVATGEPMDKAGAYAIQGRAGRWIPRVEGCYFNVVGLPLALVSSLLEGIVR